MNVSELAALPPKVLIYGPAGRGKTALALTLGETAQVLDMDGNLEVGIGLKDNLQSERIKVDVKQFLDNDYPEKIYAFNQVNKYVNGVAADCHKGTYPFKVLILDSLTALAAASENQIMGNAGKVGKAPQIQEWGLILREIENVLTTIRALPIPVFILAHETTFTAGDINQVQIAIPGQKLPGKITRMFSEIWYIRIRAVGGGSMEIYIQTMPTEFITCRSARGLKTGYKVATIHKNKPTIDSVPLWDLLKKIELARPTKELEHAAV